MGAIRNIVKHHNNKSKTNKVIDSSPSIQGRGKVFYVGGAVGGVVNFCI